MVLQVKAGVEDVISGMEVISIDDPINTIPSDSLINGELLSNPNPFNNPSSSKLVPASLVTTILVHDFLTVLN